MTPRSAAHLLPWWGSKTCRVENEPVSFLVMTDGTCVVGFEVVGRDSTTLDDDVLNESSDFNRGLINQLPENAFLQVIWDTNSGSFGKIIDEYEGRYDKLANPVLIEQRIRRADMFRRDNSLRRGQLTYWVGLKRIAEPVKTSSGFLGLSKKTVGPVTQEQLNSAAAQLNAILKRMVSMISGKSLDVRVFSESELIENCYRAANPVTAKRLSAPKFDPALYPLLKAMTLRQSLACGNIFENEDAFGLDEPPRLHRTLGMNRLPSQTIPNILGRIQSEARFPLRMSMTFESTNLDKVRRDITTRRNRMLAQASGHKRDLDAEVAKEEFEAILEKMLTEDERAFEVSLNFIVSSENKTGLDEISSQLIQLCAANEVGVVTQMWSQLPGWVSSLPGNGYRAPQKYMLMSRNCADYCLSGTPSLGDRTPDLLYHTRTNGIAKLSIGEGKPSKHALMFGGTGSGKSFHVSMLIENALSQGQHVTIIDIQGPEISSYRKMTELFGGQYYALADSEQDICLNPFLPHSQMFSEEGIDTEQLAFLENLVVMIASPDYLKGPDAKFYRAVARTAIEQAYVMTQDTGRQPILSDVQELLREYEGPEEEYNSYARTLYLQLKAWLSDQRHQRLFNRSKEFSLTGEFQVFDFFGLKEDPALGGILLLVCSHLVWNQLKRLERSSNKMVVFDEAWALIQNEAGAELIQSLYRTARKFNGCILAISQSASDVLNTPVRDAIVNNTATFFLQKHNHGFTEAAEVCQLTERKRLMLRELEYKQGEFADCLVVDKVNSNAQIVRLVPTSFDLWLNTTNPTDVAFRDHIQHSQRLSFLDAIKVLSEQHPKGAPKGFQKEMS